MSKKTEKTETSVDYLKVMGYSEAIGKLHEAYQALTKSTSSLQMAGDRELFSKVFQKSNELLEFTNEVIQKAAIWSQVKNEN